MTRSAICWLSRNVPGLAEHLVHQRGLAVVDVGNDSDVAEHQIRVLEDEEQMLADQAASWYLGTPLGTAMFLPRSARRVS